MIRKYLLLAMFISVGSAGTASAQDIWGWSTIIPSVTGTDVLGEHLRNQLQSPGQSGPKAAATPDPATLTYSPSLMHRKANLARFVEKTRTVDPAGAGDIETLFASGDIIEKIGRAMAPHHMRVDNIADAYTVWWITAWQATQGRNDTTSEATNAAVRVQAARALGATDTVAMAGDAAKQELAESLLIQSILIDASVEQAKGNPGRLRDIGSAVNQGGRGMGLELTTMTLTENGFVSTSGGR